MGKRLAEWNCRKREELAQAAKIQESKPKLTSSQAYGVGAVTAVGVLGLYGYYVYQSGKGDTITKVTLIRSVEVQAQKHTNNSKWSNHITKWTRKASLMTCTKH